MCILRYLIFELATVVLDIRTTCEKVETVRWTYIMYELALTGPANLLMGVLVGAPRVDRTEARAKMERYAACMINEEVKKLRV